MQDRRKNRHTENKQIVVIYSDLDRELRSPARISYAFWTTLMFMSLLLFPLFYLEIVFITLGRAAANRVLENIFEGGVFGIYLLVVLLMFGFFVLLHKIVQVADYMKVALATFLLAVIFLLATTFIYMYRQSPPIISSY